MGHPLWDRVLSDRRSLVAPTSEATEPRLVVLHPEDEETLALLRSAWRGAAVERVQSRVLGKEFIVVIHPDYVSDSGD